MVSYSILSCHFVQVRKLVLLVSVMYQKYIQILFRSSQTLEFSHGRLIIIFKLDVHNFQSRKHKE